MLAPEPVVLGRADTVLDLIPTVVLRGTDGYSYMVQTTCTNLAAPVSRAGTKPTSVISLEQVTERVQTIATLSELIPRDYPADVGRLEAFISSDLSFMVRAEVEDQVINGNGTPPNLSGILDRTGLQIQAKGADSTPDAIHKAITKVRTGSARVEPTGVIHAEDGAHLARPQPGGQSRPPRVLAQVVRPHDPIQDHGLDARPLAGRGLRRLQLAPGGVGREHRDELAVGVAQQQPHPRGAEEPPAGPRHQLQRLLGRFRPIHDRLQRRQPAAKRGHRYAGRHRTGEDAGPRRRGSLQLQHPDGAARAGPSPSTKARPIRLARSSAVRSSRTPVLPRKVTPVRSIDRPTSHSSTASRSARSTRGASSRCRSPSKAICPSAFVIVIRRPGSPGTNVTPQRRGPRG